MFPKSMTAFNINGSIKSNFYAVKKPHKQRFSSNGGAKGHLALNPNYYNENIKINLGVKASLRYGNFICNDNYLTQFYGYFNTEQFGGIIVGDTYGVENIMASDGMNILYGSGGFGSALSQYLSLPREFSLSRQVVVSFSRLFGF